MFSSVEMLENLRDREGTTPDKEDYEYHNGSPSEINPATAGHSGH
jgi:hypothetical protein